MLLGDDRDQGQYRQLHGYSRYSDQIRWASQMGPVAKNLPANVGDTGHTCSILGWEDPLEKEMATHSNILASEIPRTEEPGGLQFMGSQKSWTQLND